MRIAALWALTAALPVCSVGTARAGGSSAQTPEFPAEAELVTVDVVVLDGYGRPVPGLTRDDFVVKDDGRRQAIAAFEAVDIRRPALSSPETVVTTVPSAAVVSANVTASSTRRTLVIVIDDLHVDDLNMERAKRAVLEFVSEEIRPGDRVALFTTSDGRYWTTTRGPTDEAWREALGRVRSHQRLKRSVRCRIDPYEAMRIEEFGDSQVCALVQRRLAALDCKDSLLDCGRGPLAALEVLTPARATIKACLDILREVSTSLARLPGRKQLVLVSEGFILDPLLDGFREVRRQAARSNVVIHFLDARGLAVGPEFLSAAGTTRLIPAQDIALTQALWKLEDAGSKALAEETGGRVLQANDLVSGLERVAEESRVYYLLAYEPTNHKRDGRYRKLSVEVRRAGLEVRARKGYFAAKRKKETAPNRERDPVDRALGELFDEGGIPLRLAAYVMGPASKGPKGEPRVEVLVASEVDLDALDVEQDDGLGVAKPEIALLTSSREGERHRSDWTLETELRETAGVGEGNASRSTGNRPGRRALGRDGRWHPFLTRLEMAPGDHRARLVVRSPRSGRVGSVTTDFMVPEASKRRLSTPILSDRLTVKAGERRVLPVAHRAFAASSVLRCHVELLGAEVEAVTGESRATAAFVARSAEGHEWARVAASLMRQEGAALVCLLSLPLTDAPDGKSDLVIAVKDDVSGQTFERVEPFFVEGQAE